MFNRYSASCLLLYIIFISAISNAQNNSNAVMQPVGPDAYEVMRQFFEYDKTVPLEAAITDKIDKPGYTREKIIFSGTRYSKVPGYLAIPKTGSAPYPCVLLIHGLTSSKESWWEENSPMGSITQKLLESGFAVLTLDAEYHGERSGNNELGNPVAILENGWFVRSRDMMIQTVIDYRRGMDYLAARSEIDTSRIGAIGYSMGGIMTFILAAVDSRIKTAISCVSPVIAVPYLPTAVHNHAPYINDKPFLMLMANNDSRNYTKETALQLYELVGSSTKDIEFFESGHMLPAEWTIRAAEWMEKYLE